MKNKIENSELEEEEDDSELDPEEDPEEEIEVEEVSEEEIEEQEASDEEIEEQEVSEEDIEEQEVSEEELEEQEVSEEELEEQEVSEEELEEQEDSEEEIEEEEDPEEDPEEDVDEGSEEDPSEEDTEEHVSELPSKISDDKQRPVDENATVKEDPHEKSGKRRRSRWEPLPEQDKSSVIDLNPKRRKTRWDVKDTPMTPNSLKKELPNNELNLRLVEINRKILACALPDGTPKAGRRRREHCQKLIRERQRIFDKLLKDNRSSSEMFFKKLYIPVDKYPSYNFVGLILGPQGNTLKSMEKATGAKILLRGKNSSLKADTKDDPSDKEDLNVQIKANNQESLDAAVLMVEKLLVPKDDHENEHKLAQLKELAKLRGNFRDENICRICNEQGHKAFACPQGSSTLKAVISCDICGSLSHLKSSCHSLPKKPNKEVDESNLYIGYLPKVVDDSRLREMFAPFGKIVSSVVVKDKNTGQSKGYGFVKFDNIIDAATAVKHMNKYQMDGHNLAVRVAGEPQATVLPPLAPLPAYPRPLHPGGSAMATQAAWPGQPSSMYYGHVNQYGSTGVAPPPFVSGLKKSNAEVSNAGMLVKFPGDPDYPGSKF